MKAKIIIDSRQYEALRQLPVKMQNEMYNCIMEYTLYGKEPTGMSRYLRTLWILIKPETETSPSTNRKAEKSCEKSPENKEVPQSEDPSVTTSKSTRSSENEKEKLASDVHENETSPVVSSAAHADTRVHTREEASADMDETVAPLSETVTAAKEKEREETKKERSKERSKEEEQNKENLQKKNSSSFSKKAELSLNHAIAAEVDKQLERKMKANGTLKESRLLRAREACKKRKTAFELSLNAYFPRYSIPFIRAFAAYWTEPNRDGTKMHFEMTKTWSLENRLAAWERNELKFRGKKKDIMINPRTGKEIWIVDE